MRISETLDKMRTEAVSCTCTVFKQSLFTGKASKMQDELFAVWLLLTKIHNGSRLNIKRFHTGSTKTRLHFFYDERSRKLQLS